MARLVARGAEPLGIADPTQAQLRAWMWRHLPRLTRNKRHRGNHKYDWGLDRAARRHMPEPRPYPKLLVGPATASLHSDPMPP